ncbi:5'/3'-nucleotidase SurE [Porphyromonas catoniae]|jgi:5'/3'-nucleotidase surE|uniref:5'-nucleotidase SurE n=2 Tax=Porphyromonas catoniae TaxID=41976 RepID=Z4WU58_9PORP|nr:5'/3'-nucleotidase SurE [Porphyromonas catoniae]EKY03346.1 5'/3'-nucleotidase SurE [Porphyromonas catoniae F0037]EWC91285.1 5'/3'-nucleotidase SurE [Porphyromonas catoniae ATCC 51270]
MHILISNDDGFRAAGIQELAEAMLPYGDVTIVAPDGPRSGFSGAITTTQPLRLKHRHTTGSLEVYSCEGTPVDCVKLALNTIFADTRPDLVLSGINHGSNEGICVSYSGTLGAAREGCIYGIPSLAVSLDDTAWHPDFTDSIDYTKKVVELMQQTKLPHQTMLSLNVPKDKPKGLKICPMTVGRFVEEFVNSQDGRGKEIHWMTGYQIPTDEADRGDWHYLREGWATLTPLQLDTTNHSYISELRSLATAGK